MRNAQSKIPNDFEENLMDGPRGTRPEEKESLRACVAKVFRPTLWQEYPQLFNDDNLENCRVMVHDRQVVSHIGMLIRDASLLGCRIRVCNVGGVGTLPEFRKLGLATQTFADACAKAKADGCDLMIVSGDRNLYRMAGCRRVGREMHYSVTPQDFARLGESFNPCRSPVTIVPAAEKDQETMLRLCQREPVRFIRRREDYQRAMECAFVMNRPSDFWLIREGANVAAYMIVNRPAPNARDARVAEYAGARCAVIGALPLILSHYKLDKLHLHVSGSDTTAQALLGERGLAGAPGPGSGTVRVANFVQFMDRMRPYLEETLGRPVARRLSFAEEEGDRFRLRYDSECATIPNRGDVARFLFGQPDRSDEAILPADHPVVKALRPALPFPALWYGISYV
jgi:GNAT superfamily N-acetyltransferase